MHEAEIFGVFENGLHQRQVVGVLNYQAFASLDRRVLSVYIFRFSFIPRRLVTHRVVERLQAHAVCDERNVKPD